jgi:hypothetical protein
MRIIEPAPDSAHSLPHRAIKNVRPGFEYVLIRPLFVAPLYYIERWREINQYQRATLNASAELIQPANNDLGYRNRESSLEVGVGQLRCDACTQTQLAISFGR